MIIVTGLRSHLSLVEKLTLQNSQVIQRWLISTDDDRKFVAVACAHPGQPSILQAVDSKWSNFLGALTQHGVTIEYLCPANMQGSDEA